MDFTVVSQLIEEADSKLLIEFIESQWCDWCSAILMQIFSQFFFFFYFIHIQLQQRSYTDIGHWYINTNGQRWTEKRTATTKKNFGTQNWSRMKFLDSSHNWYYRMPQRKKKVKNNKHKSYCCEWMNWDVFWLSLGI